MSFIADKIVMDGLTYDDVLLIGEQYMKTSGTQYWEVPYHWF